MAPNERQSEAPTIAERYEPGVVVRCGSGALMVTESN